MKVVALLWLAAPAAAATKVDYGPISHKAQRNPEAFLDITTGSNALFGGPCCPARPGFDLATGSGSPMANAVAGLLAARG